MKELKLLLALCSLLIFGPLTAQLTVNAGNDTVICSNQPVQLGGNPVVTGGTGPYTYIWSNGATTTNQIVNPVGTVSYTLTVTDMMGATGVDVVTITVSLPTVSTQGTDVLCNGGNNGTICAHASDGVSPYTYLWSNGVANDSCIQGLLAGTYVVTATDNIGCTASDTYIVTEPAQIQLSIINNSDGIFPDTLEANVSGGCTPYLYTWNNTVTTQTDQVTQNGTYALTVTDCGGCSVTASTNVNNLTAQITTSDSHCAIPDDGWLIVTASGGTPPYMYTISDDFSYQESDTFLYLMGASYILKVKDATNQLYTVPFTINTPTPIINSAVVTNETCTGLNNGAIDLSTTGGTAPYTFTWVTADITEDITGLAGGDYIVTVTDANMCVELDTFTVVSISDLWIDSVVTTSASCQGYTDGSACIYTNNSFGNFSYEWGITPVITTACANNLAAGIYGVTITNISNCTYTTIITITQPTAINLSFVNYDGYATDTLNADPTGGTGVYTFSWNTGSTQQTNTTSFCFPFTYIVTVTDANGCIQVDSAAMSGNNHCVWPGDANNNNVADNNDLLPIGLKYGTIGFARTAADINWEEHQSHLWYDSLANGTDSRYIDCDGNGTINADDTLAIVQNFGLTHSKSEEQREWRSGSPALLVDLVPDTTRAGDTMYANLYLGDATINATNVYGLAFTLNYDVNVVDTSRTQMEFADSWLGTSSDKISLSKDLKQGQIKCAVTRIDHTNRSGSGQIARASFVITTDNINGKDLSYYGMRVWVTDLIVIDKDGLELEVNEGQDSSNIEFEPTGINEVTLNSNDLKLQPNPANDLVQIAVTEELVGGVLKLYDVQGRALTEIRVTNQNISIDTASLTSGIYIVHINTARGTITKRLIVVH